MNFREIRESNDLIDEIKNIDSLIIDVRSPFKKIWVSTNNTVVTLKKEHKTKIIQALLEIRSELARKLEYLGVMED